jgi:hypothetical protein
MGRTVDGNSVALNVDVGMRQADRDLGKRIYESSK